ncbi:leucine--tRNA ligase [Candidatus Parcubacteria bacterium]|nr:leucine--tRNA ligase [Candidatus Parcubacteria bacterium]
MENYDHKKIEQKWQTIWEKLNLYQAKDFNKRPKQYILIEFPYLSGDGLHVGHVRSYTALDALARKKRMQGYNVLYPIGWDAFGLPTENYAIKTGLHPREITKQNIKLFKRQLKSLGLSFDWSREINTSDPKYYKWTQWIFLQLFKKKLAYQAKIPINWCPKCKIGLANEEVISNKCERCGAEVLRREQKQWMLKITDYAERLLKDLEKVDYLDKIKAQQINWIGRSEGTNVSFSIVGIKESIEVFTTRIDTLFGVTALVLAPEHRIISDLKLQIENWNEVEEYIKASKKKSELERTDLEKEKTGVPLKGIFAINPVNQKKIPIWVGDYVIATYGGGAVMIVPAHDKRDYVFAKKFGLKIKEVIKPTTNNQQSTISNQAYTDYGILVNSGEFNGLDSKQAIKKITLWLKNKKLGDFTIHYKLRDWVFSRQHYWGEPIPIIHCPKCGIVPVPEKDLPVELPYVESYKPTETGQSPLAVIKDWVKTKCPQCNGLAERETDTMPNWAGSNWYFLRYIDPKNDKKLADMKKLKYWTPVDLYNGGMEHTTLHLLYSRFWHKFLFDIKVVPTSEPYAQRRSHGIVLAEDGRKMSKSFENVISPDEIVEKYGADVLRVYEMFMGPFDQTITWDTKTIEGVARFLTKVRNLANPKSEIRLARCLRQQTAKGNPKQMQNSNDQNLKQKQELEQLKHQTIKKVGQDLENMKFNTAVAALMEYTNELIDCTKKFKVYGLRFMVSNIKTLILLLAPFAPHLCEELWEQMRFARCSPANYPRPVPGRIEGESKRITNKSLKSIFQQSWPEFNEKLVQKKEIELVIQINGKVRDKILTPIDISQRQAKKKVLQQEKIQRFIKDKEIKKIIFVPGRLINLVV